MLESFQVSKKVFKSGTFLVPQEYFGKVKKLIIGFLGREVAVSWHMRYTKNS